MTTEPTAPPGDGAPSTNGAGDFFAGVVVFLIGAYALFESVRMPYFGDSGLWGAPGLTPGILGALLMALAILLMIRARGFQLDRVRFEFGVAQQRALLTFGIIVGYVVAIRLIGYVAATFLMLVLFQVVFARKRDWRYLLIWGLGLSAALTAGLYWLFAKVFLIPLP